MATRIDGKARELTVPTIMKYKAHPTKRREISDSKATGLRLVIQPKTGRMSWIVRLRTPKGKSAKIHLGAVDTSAKDTSDAPVAGGSLTLWQARQRAAEIDRKRAGGHDVVADEQAAALRKRTAVAVAKLCAKNTPLAKLARRYSIPIEQDGQLGQPQRDLTPPPTGRDPGWHSSRAR
jgi:Arm domain-containing DNA-binding protein